MLAEGKRTYGDPMEDDVGMYERLTPIFQDVFNNDDIRLTPDLTADQVEGYLRLLDRVAAGGIVFLKQLTTWRNPVDGIDIRFDEYPVPRGWTPLFREVADVQTTFEQAAWRLPRASAPVGA